MSMRDPSPSPGEYRAVAMAFLFLLAVLCLFVAVYGIISE